MQQSPTYLIHLSFLLTLSCTPKVLDDSTQTLISNSDNTDHSTQDNDKKVLPGPIAFPTSIEELEQNCPHVYKVLKTLYPNPAELAKQLETVEPGDITLPLKDQERIAKETGIWVRRPLKHNKLIIACGNQKPTSDNNWYRARHMHKDADTFDAQPCINPTAVGDLFNPRLSEAFGNYQYSYIELEGLNLAEGPKKGYYDNIPLFSYVILDNISRLLKPGGQLIMSTHYIKEAMLLEYEECKKSQQIPAKFKGLYNKLIEIEADFEKDIAGWEPRQDKLGNPAFFKKHLYHQYIYMFIQTNDIEEYLEYHNIKNCPLETARDMKLNMASYKYNKENSMFRSYRLLLNIEFSSNHRKK